MVKKSVFLLLSMIMILALCIGCSTSSNNTSKSDSVQSSAAQSSAAQSSTVQSSAKSYNFGFVVGNQTMEFFLNMKKGVEGAVKSTDKVTTYSFDDDPAKESSIFDNLIVKKVDLIFANMLDADSIYPSLLKAKKAGIPVMMIDGFPQGDKFKGLFVSAFADDLYNAGYVQGKYLCDALNGQGKIGMVWMAGLPDYFNQRVIGFKDAIAKYPGVSLAAYNEVSGVDTETAMQAISAQLQVHKDLNGYYCPWANAGLAAVSSLAAAKMSDVKIVINDSNATLDQDIVDGKVLACMDLNPGGMGQKAVESAYSYLGGEKIADNTITKVQGINIDKTNVADYLKK